MAGYNNTEVCFALKFYNERIKAFVTKGSAWG